VVCFWNGGKGVIPYYIDLVARVAWEFRRTSNVTKKDPLLFSQSERSKQPFKYP